MKDTLRFSRVPKLTSFKNALSIMSDSEAENAVVPHRYWSKDVREKEKLTLETIFNPRTLQFERIPGMNSKCES